jgi:hypothetical protein
MKIVVLDGYTENPGDLSWAPLEKYGELTVYDRTSYVDSPLIAERSGMQKSSSSIKHQSQKKRLINARTSNSLQFWRQDTT